MVIEEPENYPSDAVDAEAEVICDKILDVIEELEPTKFNKFVAVQALALASAYVVANMQNRLLILLGFQMAMNEKIVEIDEEEG